MYYQSKVNLSTPNTNIGSRRAHYMQSFLYLLYVIDAIFLRCHKFIRFEFMSAINYVDIWLRFCEGYTVAWWSQCDIVILTKIYSRYLVVVFSIWTIHRYSPCLIVNWIYSSLYVDVWFHLCEGYTVAWWSQCDIVILTKIYSRHLIVLFWVIMCVCCSDFIYRCCLLKHCFCL